MRHAAKKSLNFPTIPLVENSDIPANIKTIAAAYRNSKDESGESYKNLKLMDVRLSELREPIRN